MGVLRRLFKKIKKAVNKKSFSYTNTEYTNYVTRPYCDACGMWIGEGHECPYKIVD